MKVFKFGGASVKDATSIKNVADILKQYQGEEITIVVSAMGKTTSRLHAVVDAYFHQTGEAADLLSEVSAFHYDVAKELFADEQHPIFSTLSDTLIEIEWVIEDPVQDSYDYIYDQIVSMGEFLSTRIVAAWLQASQISCTWLDVRDVIATDNTYRAAQVDMPLTIKRAKQVIPPLLKSGFVLTQGFVGGTSENFTTTLGLEGSDYTGALLAHSLDAKELRVWKDVPGILTADPKRFDDAILLPELRYREAVEMTYYGAKVIHPKTIKPLADKDIPLVVCSFKEPSAEGTIIKRNAKDVTSPIKVVAPNQIVISISTGQLDYISEQHISHVFTLLFEHRLKVNMSHHTAVSLTICLDDTSAVKSFLELVEADYIVKYKQDLTLMTIRHCSDELAVQAREQHNPLLEKRTETTYQLVYSSNE